MPDALITSSIYPVLPLRSDVLFPFQTMPLSAGRPNSIAALQAALESEDKTLVIASQKTMEANDPNFEDLFPIGTLAVIRRMGRTDDMIHVIVHGASRVQLVRAVNQAPYLKAEVSVLPDPDDSTTEVEALYAEVVRLAQQAFELLELQKNLPLEMLVRNVEKPIHFVYMPMRNHGATHVYCLWLRAGSVDTSSRKALSSVVHVAISV